MSSNTPLIDPATDYTLNPEPHSPPAGDWKDDDGLALDSYFQAMDLRPLAQRFVAAMGEFLNAPKKGSRIVRANYVLPGAQAAVRALPADADRTYLCIVDLNNIGFYFHSEAFTPVDNLSAAGHQTAAVFVGATANAQVAKLELYEYTGPVWVSSNFTGPSLVEVLAVTA